MKTKQFQKSRLLFLGLLLAMIIPFYLIYFNNTFPFTEGWGIYYAELVKAGLTPYKDFYYYLPPINLGIDWILWSCSGGYFIVYRFYRLLERLVMISLIYWILSKYFKTRHAFLSTFAGAVLGAASVYDLMGDYSQTGDLLYIILILLVTQYVEQKSQKIRYLLLFVTGFEISLLFFIKQSNGAAAVIIYSLVFCIYSYKKKNKFFIKEVLFVLFGALIPIVLCASYLVYNHALTPFIEQVLLSGSNSKGGLFTIIFSGILASLGRYPELILFLNILLIGKWYQISVYKSQNLDKMTQFFMWGILILLPLLESVVFYRETAYAFFMFIKGNIIPIVIFIVILALIYLLLNKFVNINNWSLALIIMFCISIFMGHVLVFLKNDTILEWLYNTHAFDLLINVGSIVFFILVYLEIYSIIKSKSHTQKHDIYIMLITGALASIYAGLMVAGTSPMPMRSMFISMPVVLSILLEYGAEKSFLFKLKNGLIASVVLVCCLVTFSQKYCCSYSWWGWTEEKYSQKNETIDVRGMEGIRVSSEQKKIYEQIVRLIEENTTDESVIYGFPYLKIFNILTNKIEDPGFIPVPFYDVCGDEYAIAETELLKKNKPDIVLWCDIPTCMEVHEMYFRNGKELGQRKIVEWFKEVKDTEYEKIGQVSNVFVYKRKEGTKPQYTFYEDENRINSTLEE